MTSTPAHPAPHPERPAAPGPGRVVVAHGGRSAPCRAAVRWASWEASRRGLPLRVNRHWTPAVPEAAELVVADARLLDTVSGSPCPVVLVPEEFGEPFLAEVVLGVDARDPAAGAAGFAFGTARRWGVRLRAVHGWRFPSCAAELPFGIPEEDRGAWEDHEVQLLSDALRPWREQCPEVEVLEDVRLLTPVQALVRRSASSGLLVVGRREPGGLGSVARGLVHESRCPVAVVPS
ncbi:universal stress protein [Streptomyces fructofermentans]|uniref:universal stress protein n=1 Tax=Streptomyces fructofermentans TaxID=152141 RepID=UPI0033ED4653